MKSARFLVVFTILTISNNKLISQIDGSLFADVYSQDSLQGFDLTLANQQALAEGFYGAEYTKAIKAYKRNFVINKYNLNSGAINPPFSSGGKYSSALTANAPCVNSGFENGTISGWSAFIGTNANSQAYPNTPTPITVGSDLAVLTTPLNDAFVGTIPNSPLGGSRVVRINNSSANFSVVKLTQTFNVTANNYLFDFAYWAVMQDAGSAGLPHTCSQTPFMLIKIRDNFNILQGCPTFSIVAPSAGVGGCAGIGPLSWVTVGSGGNTIKTSSGWQQFSIDLTPYITSPVSNITVEIFVGDCSLGAHWGYAYFDARCNTMDLTVNNQTISMPSPTVVPQVLCGSTATMTAPGGLGPYLWNGPVGSGILNNTNQTIITSVPGNYSLTMTPAGICNPIAKIANLQFVPPTTITVSQANLCSSGTNTSSTLSASGASQYTWMPGGSNLASIVVTPTSTTIYTLTARTGTCTGTFTTQITVNPDPVINVLSSNSSLCPGQTATLTAFGASSYVWQPGALTGSSVVVSQIASTTYTTIGTSAAGCSGTFTTAIATTPASTVAIFPATVAPICAGQAVNLIGIGAPSFTWQPGNVTGIFQTFTPTVTTTYTAIGSAGTCTSSTVITITVDPGPSMTVTANPTLTCPGNTTTLSVVAPLAVGAFTWNPGALNGTSIVVTPTIAGGYSVSAANALGCVNTQTINPAISPLPNIVVSPSTPSICPGRSATLTASGATSYTWQPGNLTGASVVLSPTTSTTYTVSGSNGAGCTSQTTVAVTVLLTPTITALVTPTAICAGSCATISPGGASSYTIQGGSFVVCPPASTTFSLIGSSAAGCTSTPIVIPVTVNSNPVVNAVASPSAICAGSSSTLTASGALSYTWSTGSTSSSLVVSPASTQTYSVTGANAFGCSSTATVTVTVNPLPLIAVNPPAATVCPGRTVSLQASGAGSYTWFPGNITGANAVVSPTSTTVYTVIGSSGSCSGQNTVQVTLAPGLTITAAYSPTAICAGSCATLVAAGGATSYAVAGLSPIACPTVSTNYSVVGTSINGCLSNTVTGTLFVNNGPTLTVAAAPATICPGGSAVLNASGASTYTWFNGSNSSTTSVSPAVTTVYTVTGATAFGCTRTATVLVTVNPTPNIVISPATPSLCAGASVLLSASGASSYTWAPGGSTGTSLNVSPLVNTVYTVSGSNGSCTGQNTVLVTVSPNPTINVTSSSGTVCAGTCVTLTPGGASTYTFSGGSAVVCPTVTTTYSVTGRNTAGCLGNTAVVTITAINTPTLNLSASASTICSSGSTNLFASGANTYTWQPGNLTGANIVVTPSASTVYTATGTNLSGCTSSSTINIVVIPSITLTAASTPTSICAGGSAALTAGGASSYLWNPGNFSGTNIFVTPTVTTTYTLTGTVGICTASTVVTVVVNPNPSLTIVATPTAVCSGNSATLTASGGSTYLWDNGSTSSSRVVSPLTTTTYSLNGSSAAGCAGTTTFVTVAVNNNPVITANATPSVLCSGGSSTLTAGGALNYTWQPVNLNGYSITVSPLANTIYTVTGSNAAGCSGSQTVQVNVSSAPAILVSSTVPSVCAGSTVGLTASGASTYTWLPGNLLSPSISPTPTVTTTYTVLGSNAGGCTGQNTITVVVVPNPTVTTSATSTNICNGSSATITALGASTYTWLPVNMFGSSVVVSPGSTTTYTVLGTLNGCTGASVRQIVVSPNPNVTASASPSAICTGQSSTLTASGALTYTWQPVNQNGSSITVSPIASSVYSVTGTSANGCTAVATLTLPVAAPPLTTITALPSNTICSGSSATLVASGATNYTWLPGSIPAVSAITVTPGASTIYTLLGSNGICVSQTTLALIVSPSPTVNVSASSLSVCVGGCSTLTASGASTYLWSNGGSGSQNVVCPGVTTTYSVTGSLPGCSTTTQITVFVAPSISLSVNASANPICSGTTATLTGFGATSYSWSTGTTGSLIVVSPATNSVYTLYGTSGSCSAAVNYTLNVTPTPVISILNIPTSSVCAGFTTTLVASGAPSFTWLPGNFTSNPLVVAPLSSTTYTVIGNNSGCTATNTVSVNVVPLPPVNLTANPPVVCAGNTTTLTASGAATYTWIPSLLSGATFTDNPSVTTTYTVVGIGATGCPNFTIVTVTVTPLPNVAALASSTAICAGASATLTGNGASNYTWTPGLQTTPSIIVTPLATTVYTVTGGSGGCLARNTITIMVNTQPLITAAASTQSVCPGGSVNIVASGGVSYTWTPPGSIGSFVTVNPLVSTTYSLTGQNASGCTNTTSIFIFVHTLNNLTAVASPSDICEGNSATLTASGAQSYTWNPGSQTGNSVSVIPVASTIYTLTADDISGCTQSLTIPVNVYTNPAITISPFNPTICAVSSVTLTANGATNYTWLPSGLNTSAIVESPGTSVTYTVIGDNGGLCASSETVSVFVNPLPQNVVASSIGTVSCVSPTVSLFASTTNTNVSYLWSGPQGYNSTVQNPIVSDLWGTFTLNVTDNETGCTASATVDVPTDNSIPLVTAVASGSITCAVPTITLNALNTTTNPDYVWIGPAGFTSTVQSPVVNEQGTYTITLTDLSSGCTSSAVVTVETHTNVTVEAVLSQPTCSAGVSNDDGSITLTGFTGTDRYDLVSGLSYTGTATYITANTIPVDGIITASLANPTSTVAYTVRLFDAGGCIKDTTLILNPVDCALRTLGIAKAVSAPELNADGAYNLTYTVVVINYNTDTLSNISLIEDLAATFPLPTTFTVGMLEPLAGTTTLAVNPAFNGRNQTNLLSTSPSNSLASHDTATIRFTVTVKTPLYFVPFRNSIIGQATNQANVVISDSSQFGLNPDPDNDGNPYNNNLPTSITFTPSLFFGITKIGEINKSDNASFDVSYTVTVHNLGNDTIRDVNLNDVLFGKAIPEPATYSIRSAPVAIGNGLVANPLYDGKNDIRLVTPSGSKMYPKSTSSIRFVINVEAGTMTAISNSAYGNGLSAISATQNIIVSDTSNAGTNPDVNGNGISNEPSDNLPTILLIPNTSTLFIPEGFSPNGDNNNDLFVIKGLPTETENAITIFNRWGNKVYSNGNYDNSWDGTPNVSGSLGNSKLPPGTYYYILEIKGNNQKPITGFVVIQY